MDEDEIGLKFGKAALKPLERLDGDVGEGLIFSHDVEVGIGRKAEAVHDGIEHLAVLCGDADETFDALAAPELQRERRHFYRLRASPENGHDLELIHLLHRPFPLHPPAFHAAGGEYCYCA